jgi:hypothetical protein
MNPSEEAGFYDSSHLYLSFSRMRFVWLPLVGSSMDTGITSCSLLLLVVLVRTYVVANTHHYEIQVMIYQSGRFYLDIEVLLLDILSDLISPSGIFYRCVSRYDYAVLDLRISRVPYIALDFPVGIVAAEVTAPYIYTYRTS